ncbi:MAG: PKD domain-containing protein [Bacteroidota bacterium]|nr:PKD domain-containing protein [Bacteroidota bacterium]
MKTTTTKTKTILSTLMLALFLLIGNNLKAQVCTASFNYTVNANGNVSFLSTSVPSTLNCQWSFGNSQNATGTSASTTYTANGTYTVWLFTWNSPTTCSATATQTILITNAATNTCNLQAGFTKTVGANGAVYFTNTSTNTSTLTSYYWTINNNYFSSVQNPTTTLNNGYYTICLNVTDSLNNCFDSYCDSVFITNSTNTCSLNANFSYTLGSNGSVSFASTSTGTNANTNYSWWFGNNQSANTANASTNYPFNGFYTVCLFLTNNNSNCTSSYCDTLQITNASNSSTCNASFNFTVGTGGNVIFASNSTGTTSSTNYLWSFNNTTSSTGPTASQTFTNFFNYVCLTIYDSTSLCFSTYCDTVIIPSLPCNPNVNFVMVQDTSQALTWWAFANYPSNVTNAVWSWGDNSSSTGFFPSHTYSASGFYNICVTITVSCAGTASFCSNTFINKSAEAPLPMYHVNVAASSAPTSIKVNTAKENMTDILLFPNPAKELTHLRVNMTNAGDISIAIYEITGKLVQQQDRKAFQGVNEVELQTNDLKKGMYFVTINSGNAKKTVRLIKE